MELVEGQTTIDDLDAFVSQLDAISEEYGATVQAFDARYVVDRAHLERALALADRAIERDENVARERAIEILLYAAGRRQIDQALEVGVSPGEATVVVLVDGENESGAVDAVCGLLEPTAVLGVYDEERVRDYFDITEAEVAATDASLSALVRERVALLDVEK